MNYDPVSLAKAAILTLVAMVSPAAAVAQDIFSRDGELPVERHKSGQRSDICIDAWPAFMVAEDVPNAKPSEILAPLLANDFSNYLRPISTEKPVWPLEIDANAWQSLGAGGLSNVETRPVFDADQSFVGEIRALRESLAKREYLLQRIIFLSSWDSTVVIVEQLAPVTSYGPDKTLLAPPEGPQQFSMPAIGSAGMDALLGK